MTRRSTQTAIETDDIPALAIPLDKVCSMIFKAREFDAKEAANEPDPGSNASDDKMISVLEDQPDDPVEEELRSFISELSEDEQIDLVALAWLGRDDNTLSDWPSIRTEAARAHASHPNHTANYLMGEPLVSDFLEEALSMFGKSCEEFEIDRL
jgi:hypothetical protein